MHHNLFVYSQNPYLPNNICSVYSCFLIFIFIEKGQLIFALKSKNDFVYKQVLGNSILNHSGKGFHLPTNIESRHSFQHKLVKLPVNFSKVLNFGKDKKQSRL
jgi:hypothetical protein